LVVTQHGEGTTAKPGFVYSVLAELLNLYYWFAQTVSLRFASRIIFYTQSYPESLGLGTKIKERIRIVRNGVDSQRFSPRSDGSRLRAKYGFDSTNKVLLFVGALPRSHRYKGVDYLIEAVHIARSKNTTIKLAVVGGGGLVPELNKLVAELELGQNVVFTGAMPNEHLPPYYAMCDIFVLPSVSSPESFGQVLQEAMASGKPCIASDLPGVREVVKNEKTGLLVPPKNPEALAQAILHLAEDDSLRNEMSHNARMEVASYSWQKCAQEMEAIYNEVLGL
jgi:glycosyltransferase involved in cell wall biosynthesis